MSIGRWKTVTISQQYTEYLKVVRTEIVRISNISTLPLYHCISKVLYEKLSFIQCYKKLFFVKRYLYEMFPSFKIF